MKTSASKPENRLAGMSECDSTVSAAPCGSGGRKPRPSKPSFQANVVRVVSTGRGMELVADGLNGLLRPVIANPFDPDSKK
ncbi:MAG: hypothetical protein N2109_08625 [Fimbriimonadales bacterium]|nr:hypothetical protein [Fimbriimonadales bacterium]